MTHGGSTPACRTDAGCGGDEVRHQPLGSLFARRTLSSSRRLRLSRSGFAVCMSLPRLLLRRPRRGRWSGRSSGSTTTSPRCPTRRCAVVRATSLDLPGHQRAADRGPVAGAGHALNAAVRGRDLLAGLATTCPTSRPASRSSGSGCSCSAPTAWSTSCSGRWRPTRPGWSTATLAMPLDRALRHLEAARLLHPALPRSAAERARRSCTRRPSIDGAGELRRRFRNVTIPGVRPATTLVVLLATITGANLFTEPYLLTSGGGPNGASTSPVLLMYQQGIEQGNPDIAAAIGVLLVIGVLVISLVIALAGERLTSRSGTATRCRRSRTASLARAVAWCCSSGRVGVPVPLLLHADRLAAEEPDTSLAGAFPQPGNLTLDNYVAINERIDLAQSLVNSGIFTGGVLLCTVVFGVLAGYALALLHFRGRAPCSPLLLLVQVVPFQLLMIPLYVLIVRNYGLADTLPRDDPAVRDQLDRGVHLPAVLPAAARRSCSTRRGSTGPSELRHPVVGSRCRWSGRPCHRRAAHLHRPVERVPLAVPDHQAGRLQPLAVSLANYISNVAGRAANPFGAILAGACVLPHPRWCCSSCSRGTSSPSTSVPE